MIYDRFGDFAGFELMTEHGRRLSFRAREEEIEHLALEAWRERMVISVIYDDDGRDEARPIRIILRRAPG